ncbi:aminopeptidase P family protein [Flavihumibacter petaseus]|uniref:Xaa-Pro aminopeptidase n=1 Tax=Flavihumibacter petaseus NBRC 106054 TaxID=1220578 RepID=A0A0E9N2Z1_9BACT|nr:aminopeptidase P family protein [Flavihumibacter petaseus]GAO44153.1 Xaa-Pro aminopeptidase [Flavihumibacter petaseus NBRC 106054]
MRKFLMIALAASAVAVCTPDAIQAQLPQPKDYLPASFHKGRREALRALMPANSVAVFFSAPVRNFANDVDYRYHPNPDLYYFSGYTEPEAVLLIFKEEQKTGEGKAFNELFFVQEKDSANERWTGKRLGKEGVREKLGIQAVYNGQEFKSFPLDLTRFDQLIYEGVKNLSDDPENGNDVYDLVQVFRKKAGIPASYDETIAANVAMLPNYPQLAGDAGRPKLLNYYQRMAADNPRYANDSLVQAILNVKDSAAVVNIINFISQSKINAALYAELTQQLRQIKTPEEMELLRKAVDISCLAHAEAMKAVKPGMSEMELQGVQEFIHKKLGAEDVAYGSIVGAGENGCILHYETNTATEVGQNMVLMDVGAMYHGYAADVTRTFPANGKFSREQRQIYDLVYDAQEAVFKIAQPGTTFKAIEDTARAVLTRGMLKLGLIQKPEDIRKYYPHGCSHFIGLDVHDKGDYSILKENMVITVEPGIYIPENSPVDRKWWNIAVRIEDDIRITKKQCELLSTLAPRKAAEIEKLIAESSFVDGLQLPRPGDKKGF